MRGHCGERHTWVIAMVERVRELEDRMGILCIRMGDSRMMVPSFANFSNFRD